ncbi:MAG: caspase family protein [Thermodesulfobacteriota bacterium]
MRRQKWFGLMSLLFFAIAAGFNPAIAAEKSEIFVQLGHTGSGDIHTAFFSPDGKYFLSKQGGEYCFRLWDVAKEKEIRAFFSEADKVISAAFSPDSRSLLTGGSDNTVKVWDIATAKEIKSFSGHSAPVASVVFSPDERHVLSGSEDTTLKLWNAATGEEVRTFKGHIGTVNSVGFSPNGRQVVSGSSDGTVRLWDVATGKEVKSFTGKEKVASAALLQNGKYILTMRYGEKNYLSLYEVNTEGELWQKQMGDYLHIAISPDGSHILSGGYKMPLQLFETASGKEVRNFSYDEKGTPLAFSPDGKNVLSAIRRELLLWNAFTGNTLRTFSGLVKGVTAIAVSPDGRAIISGEHDGTVRFWNMSAGKETRTSKAHEGWINSLSFSPDSRFAVSGSHDKNFKLWDAITGTELRTFIGHSGEVTSVVFSPNGRYLLSGGGFDKTARLWDVQTGSQIRTFVGTRAVFSVAFSRDGKYAVSAGTGDYSRPYPMRENYALKVWDIYSGRELNTFDIHTTKDFETMSIKSALYSPDGRKIVLGISSVFNPFDPDASVKLWEISSGEVVREFRHPGLSSIALSPDGRLVLSGSTDNTFKLWDISTGNEIRTYRGHATWVSSVAFSPDGRYAYSGSWDGTVRMWNVATGSEIAMLASFRNGEWLIITPEGYYNSSANGDKHLNVRIGNNVYGIDQYRSAFYKPQIVETALRLGDTQKAIAETLGVDKQKSAVTVASIQNIEPPFIVIKSPEDGKKMNSTDAEVSLYIEDRNQTIKRVKVFVNGRQVTGSEIASPRPVGARNDIRGIEITPKGIEVPEGKKTLDLKIPVSLDIGENLIEVTAFNGFSEGRKSVRIYLEVAGQASRLSEAILPNLWILSIGINKYQDKNLTPLSYAVADAEGIVEAFKSQKGRLFREINSLIISDSSSIKPTYDSILDNLNYLSKASANDIVLLFIAGHGINDDRGDFYFLPADAVIMNDGTIKKSKAIPWRELKAILDLPSKKLIFADTCHSEGVAGKKTRGVDNDRFVKELQEANAVIFTSSRGRELSQESDKWKHGAFTYAIIEGISGKADLIKDNKVSMKELDTYVSETVPKITNGAQHPITNTPDGYVNFPVAVVSHP